MTEWITQEDWSTVKVGDQVRVTRDEDSLAGKIISRESITDGTVGLLIDLTADGKPYLAWDDVWSLSVPAKPAVQLPTGVGFYLSKSGGVWQIADGGNGLVSLHKPTMCLDASEFAPFTKLEPVHETAKKVLDKVGAWAFGACHPDDEETATEMNVRLRKEFGVTDE